MIKASESIWYMLLAVFLFALMNVFVKYLSHIPIVEIIFFRSLISLVFSVVALKAQRVPLLGNNKKFLLMRGSFGAIALFLYFSTLQKMPLASATTIQFLSPIFATLLGTWIVREKLKPWQFIFFAVSFIGVLTIKGFDTRISTFYFIVGVLAAFFAGLAYNCIRKLSTSEHPLVIVLYFPLVTLPIFGFFTLLYWKNPIGWDWLFLILVGVLTQFAQYFTTKAYQKAEISKVASLKYIGIIYALGFGFILFDERFKLLSYIGMALVLIGIAGNVWYKNKLECRKKTI